MMDAASLAHLLDLPFPVEAALEGPTLRIGDLLALSVGGVIVTRRAAGENIDVFAGGAWIGSGELAGLNGAAVVRMVNFKGKS
jgi:flagellar motor switch/type III secretory pathway protein FliN